jgi:inhibitor of cysteine peptidase
MPGSSMRATAYLRWWHEDHTFHQHRFQCRRRRSSKLMLSLTQTDNDRTVSVRMGETVRVTFSENATTGYRWAIEQYDDELFEALPAEPGYASNAIGSGGDVAFLFQAKKPGTGTIALKHWRHWEGDSSITNRFRLQLRVQS